MARTAVSAIRGSVTLGLLALNTIVVCIPFYLITLLRFLPGERWRDHVGAVLVALADVWIRINNAILALMTPVEWDVELPDDLHRRTSYLVTSNHQSWVDILVLQRVFLGRIPFLRFFLKRQLIWVPFLGLAWWALDFPFMRRYPAALLEKHPELRGHDLAETRRACARFRTRPVSILNFFEGTRFTPEKHAAQESPYRNLLKPKAGGAAFALSAMEGRIRSLVDVTIAYPDGTPTLWDLCCGRIGRVVVRAEVEAIPEACAAGDYLEDATFREGFQAWVRELWERKDARVEELTAPPSRLAASG